MLKPLVAAAAATIVGISASACTGDRNATTADHVDKVSYLTAVGAFGRESYVWVAQEKGFFAAANIDVQILPGSGTTDNLALLAAGKADFSANDLSAVMIVLSGGKHRDDVRAVAAIQQRTLNSVTTLSSTGVAAPRDLAGRTIGGVAGGAPWLLFPAYARLAGVDLRTVRWVHAEAAQLPPALAAGRVEGIGTFVVARPGVEKAARGRTVVVLPYSDVLTDLYGNALLAATRVVRDDPDLVRRFAQALLKGLVYAVEHPEEAGQILHRRVPAQDPATAAAELTLMRPYVRVNGTVGPIESTRVARAIAILSGAGVLTGPLEPDDVVAFDTTVGGVR